MNIRKQIKYRKARIKNINNTIKALDTLPVTGARETEIELLYMEQGIYEESLYILRPLLNKKIVYKKKHIKK